MSVSPVPDGYHAITPYLIVKNAASAIEFYRNAFDAEELMRLDVPGGMIGHAELQIGDSRIMLADEHPEMNAFAPPSPGGSGVGLCLYVPNVDEVFARAVDAGASVQRPVQDQFYGDRSGMVTDPFGHAWTIATHVEDVPPEELTRRMQAMTSG